MPSTIALETDLRLASSIERWQRSILLNLAGTSQLDVHLSHAIVSHAENASIRMALIEACLGRFDSGPARGTADAEQMPFSVGRLLSIGQSAPIPLVLEMARLRQAFYRRLRMLARRTRDLRILRVCDEIYRQESDFVMALRARLASATTPLRVKAKPRAVSPLDAMLARRASSAWASVLPDLQIDPGSPPASHRPQ